MISYPYTPTAPLSSASAQRGDEMEFTDRYKALGIPYPDPETTCKGPCEGTGFVPIKAGESDPVYRALWQEAHLNHCTPFQEMREGKCDGWHFVRCQDCMGTGKRKP